MQKGLLSWQTVRNIWLTNFQSEDLHVMNAFLVYCFTLSLFSLFPFLKNMKNYQSKGNKIFFKKITFKTLSLQFNLQLFWEIQDSCTETLACLYHMLVIYTYLLEWNFFFYPCSSCRHDGVFLSIIYYFI